jgi:hypothetical protein
MKVKWIETDWGYGFEFIFYTERGDNRHPEHFIATDIQGGRITFRRLEPGAAMNEPTLRLEAPQAHEFIQTFLDEAYEKGYRPTKEKRTLEQAEREMERIEDHLEDMRSLVFKMPPLEARKYYDTTDTLIMEEKKE